MNRQQPWFLSVIPKEYRGRYAGTQPAYEMRDKQGKIVEVNGKTITVPAILEILQVEPVPSAHLYAIRPTLCQLAEEPVQIGDEVPAMLVTGRSEPRELEHQQTDAGADGLAGLQERLHEQLSVEEVLAGLPRLLPEANGGAAASPLSDSAPCDAPGKCGGPSLRGRSFPAAVAQAGQLRCRIPAGRRCDALAAPAQAPRFPSCPPACVGESGVIVRHPELKSAGGANLV